jgi:hypothetical protein
VAARVTGEVLRWRACGFTADASTSWLSQGRTLAELEELGVAADEGPWVVRWARLVGTALGSEAVVEWARFGAPVGVWGEVAHLRVPLREALTWRDAGFTAYVAAGCLGVGMTLADACALRGLPTRQVQEAWREHPSIDVVRQMVEAAEEAANGTSRDQLSRG